MRQREIEEKYRRDHEQSKIDPNFMRIISDISANKGVYTPEKVEELLKPYKENGVLEQYVKRLAAMKEAAKNNPNPAAAAPGSGMVQGMPSYGMMKPMFPIMPVRSDKYKTVPCKYFHSPLGCQKKEECTFIHDETCAGFPTRNMHRYVKGMDMPPNYYMMPKPGMPIPRSNNPNPNSPYTPMDPTVNINLNSLNHNGGVPLTNMNRPQHPNSGAPGSAHGTMPMINSMAGYNSGAPYPYQSYPYGPASTPGANLGPSPFLTPPLVNLPPPPAPNGFQTQPQQNSANRNK